MSKVLLVILGLTALAIASLPLKITQGATLARLIRNDGQLTIPCEGGSGNYLMTFGNLPTGWRQEGNNLIIPLILTAKGEYEVYARVIDSEGNTIEGKIILNINGIIVNVLSSIGSSNVISATVDQQTGQSSGGSSQSSTTVIRTQTIVDNSYLYENEAGIDGDFNVLPESGKYPVAPSPEGTTRLPNVIPTVIQKAQATYSVERDGREVTVDEVARNAAFHRQLNANKAVANLLAIIQQLTANVNAAKADIVLLERKLVDAEVASEECNGEVFSMTNTRTKIENAIKARKEKVGEAEARIAELRAVIAELTRKRDALVAERTIIENEKSPNAARLAALEQELLDCQNKKRKLEYQLVDLRNQIASVEAEIQSVRDGAADAPNAIKQIDEQIPIVDKKIEDLRRQLAEAEAEKAQLQSDRQMYVRMIQEAEAKIAVLQSKLQTLINTIPSLEREIEAIQAHCDGILAKLNALRDEIAANQADYKILTEEIRVQNGLIQDREDEIDRLQDAIKKLPSELVVLQNELARILNALRRQYYICNDKVEIVKKAKIALDAMVLKYNTQSQYLLEANTNLEAARSEKEVADLAVEEIIRSTTDATLFPIVPNGQGETDPGLPAGNNPSGSALGEVSEDVQHPVIVGNLNHYLSTIFGIGYSLFPDNLVELHKVNVVTREALMGEGQTGVFNRQAGFQAQYPRSYRFSELADFDCLAKENARGRGRVLFVQAGVIGVEISEDGNTHEEMLEISPCTSINSVNQYEIIIPGDQLFYVGHQAQQGGHIAAHKVLCA